MDANLDHMGRTQQLRPPGETKWYCPARDITVFTPTAIRMALQEWEKPDNVYRQLGTNIRVYTNEDVCKIAEALAAFVSVECVVETDSYLEAWKKSGLEDIPFHLRMVVMSLIGEQFLSAFWFGIRGATTKQDSEEEFEITQYDPEALAAVSQQLCKLIRMPRWKRKLYIWWDDVRRRLIKKLKGE